MKRCRCEIVTECEVKTDQTIESIENTRGERGDRVVGEALGF